MQPLFSQDCSATIPDSSLRLLAGAAICLLTFVNCFGVKGSAKIQNVFGFIKLAALGLIIVAGIVRFSNGKPIKNIFTTFRNSFLFEHFSFNVGDYENFENPFQNSNTDPGSIALAFFSGIYAYGGANTLNAMTEEVKNPNRLANKVTTKRNEYMTSF